MTPSHTSNKYAGIAIYDPDFDLTFTFGEQVATVDGEPIFETFANGSPWMARFSGTVIDAMIAADNEVQA